MFGLLGCGLYRGGWVTSSDAWPFLLPADLRSALTPTTPGVAHLRDATPGDERGHGQPPPVGQKA